MKSLAMFGKADRELLMLTLQVALETADGPRQTSEAATVSPEVVREDEERRVLASSQNTAHADSCTK